MCVAVITEEHACLLDHGRGKGLDHAHGAGAIGVLNHLKVFNWLLHNRPCCLHACTIRHVLAKLKLKIWADDSRQMRPVF